MFKGSGGFLMIGIKLIAVGSLKEKYLRDAFAEYEKRLTRYCNFQLCELSEAKLKENPSDKEIQKALDTEGKAILRECSGFTAAMCIEGKQLSSIDFAGKIEKIASEGVSRISFVIGSSYGLSGEVKRNADLKLSMSDMTFPHQLARVMLAEQIYRAFQINSNGKYHK